MSIRWKIAVVCILLAVIPILYFNQYTIRVFDGFTRRMFEEQMIDYAHVIADDFRRQFEEQRPDPHFTQRLQDYQKRFEARLMIVQLDGYVLYDSDEPSAAGSYIGDHRDIQLAIDGRYGARTRLTEDRQLLFYHIAIPILNSDGERIGVASVQAHTRDITRAVKAIMTDYRMAMLIAAIIAILTAILFAWTLTFRLRALTSAAKRFARGETRFDAKPRGRDEIAQLGKAVAQMADEINRISQHQSQLMDTTIHQLKTPLTAIKGAADIISEENETPETRERFLQNIHKSADRLMAMIYRMGELSRLKTEELRGTKSSVQYQNFVTEIVQRLYPDTTPPIECHIQTAHATLWLQPERIEQVIVNLLDNALRHTPATGNITLRAHVADKHIVTTVEDNGSGIEPSDLESIFDQFFTTVPRNQTSKGGMGLGLTIAKSIIENHGGTLTATSMGPQQGACFTFTLPL